MDKNNVAKLIGTVASSYEYSHSVYGEDFYMFYLSVGRKSGYQDILPVLVSSKIIDIKCEMVDQRVSVEGTFRSYNKHSDNERNKLLLFIFADNITLTDMEDYNFFWAEGFLCRQPNYRKTPAGREIADIILAVNRAYNRSDYLPVIAWGRNAVCISGMRESTKIQVTGRIQSRNYFKPIGAGTETRVAYEVSASRIDVCRAAGGGSYECDEEPGGSEV
jgi:primosomal replication protein N